MSTVPLPTWLCLLALAWSLGGPTCAVAALPPDHGFIHFFEAKPAESAAPPAEVPEVRGAEGIFWWGDIETEDGVYDWSRIDRELARCQAAGRLLDVRLATAHNGPFMTPDWLFERYQVRRIGRGCWADFEEGWGDYAACADGLLSNDPRRVVGGRASVAGRATDKSSQALLELADRGCLEPGATINVQYDYQASQPLRAWIECVPVNGSVTQRWNIQVPAGRGSVSHDVRLPDLGVRRLRFGFDGPGALSLDHVNCMRLDPQPRAHLSDFEDGAGDWRLLGGAHLTRDPHHVLSGRTSLLLAGVDDPGGHGIENDPSRFRVERGQGYAVQFRYKAVTAAVLRYRIVSRDAPFRVLDERTLTLAAGASARQGFHYPAFVWQDNCRIELGVAGTGEVVVDELSWTRWSDRVTCFPDYFNPVFAEKWERFVTRFAERYGAHPGLGTLSVGGFGRWEETILDDDAYGGLDAQWLARGYTQERYLARVVACMDLYRRLLPAKPLRICLAFGLHGRNDRDWLYRRVAQAAVERGIGLKQNGLSEKWDAWDDNTSASYLWNRYRHRPDVTLTLETGGQISRPGPGQGHPVSFLNRGLIDGTDLIFLYGADIQAREVQRHLRWASEQMGRPLLTSFFCRLGETAITHEHSPAPMVCRNVWLGLRQFETDSGRVIYTNRFGESCAATGPGNPRIVFDVDDRQQYHGLCGVGVSVKYLDEGRDSFAVTCFNNTRMDWDVLGRVRKTDSGTWRIAAFLKSDWCRSPRNTGEDIHADLAIEDEGDGAETVAAVELHFVPAREWARTMVSALETGGTHRLLTNSLEREIALPNRAPVHWIAVPIWTGSLQRNGLRGRVWACTEGGNILVADKEYCLPADRDWFELPVVPVPGCDRYCVELSQPMGDVGWYEGPAGELAYRAWRYDVSHATVLPEVARDGSVEFDALEPFCGLSLVWRDGGAANRAWRLQRFMGSSWADVIHGEFQPGAEFHFEPQTPGRYRLAQGGEPARIELGGLRLFTLVRRDEVRAPLPAPQGTSLLKVELNPQRAEGLRDVIVSDGRLAAILERPEASLDFNLAKPVEAAQAPMVLLALKNATGAGLARLYWAGLDQDFSPIRSVWIPIVSNDTALRTYACRLDLEPSWRGRITRLRLVPSASLIDRGRIQLGGIEFQSRGVSP